MSIGEITLLFLSLFGLIYVMATLVMISGQARRTGVTVLPSLWLAWLLVAAIWSTFILTLTGNVNI